MMSPSANKPPLPIWLTLWIPLFFLGGQVILEYAVNNHVMGKLLDEDGPYEILQFILISAACFVSLYNIFFFKKHSKRFLVVWCAIAALCCFYVAGEEISWGQHFYEWETPEEWSKKNDQNETNLHNTSSWLDQKPRLLLLIGIIMGGIIFPLVRMKKELPLPSHILEILPHKSLMFIAFCVVVPQIIEKIGEAMGVVTFVRVSEIQELYMFYFVLLYLISLKKNVISQKQLQTCV